MAQGLEIALGLVLGLGLIAGLFCGVFRRMPEAREGPGVSYDASRDWSPPGDSHDGHSG